MPLLHIATPQSSFRNNLYSIGFQRFHHVSFNPITARWRYFHNPAGVQTHRGCLMIRAVATLEPVSTDKEHDNAPPLPPIANIPATDEKPPIQDDKELLRRKRISKANKGKEAWNKGMKHSPETLQKIRERTRIAMSSPQVKMKLLKGIHNQTILIGEAQRAAEALEAVAAKSPMAESSLIETRKLIAEAMSYIKSIEMGNTGSSRAGSDKEEIVEGVKEIARGRVNGTPSAEIAKLGDVGLKANANVNGTAHVDLSASSSLMTWSDSSLKRKEVEEDGEKQKKGGKGRRWVYGRLVEDEDEDEDEDQ